MSQELSSCINCKSEFSGSYCSNCGQPAQVSKISLKSLIKDFNDKFFGLDTKFGRTLKYLLFDPKQVAASFIEGNRVAYIGPVSFCFLMLTIFVLLAALLDVDIQEATESTSSLFTTPPSSAKQEAAMNQIRNFMFNNFRLVVFMLVPFFGLSQMILFRKDKYNFFEHTSITLFIHGEGLVFTIIALVLFYFTGNSFQIYSNIIGAIYTCYAFARIYEGNAIANFFKGLLVFFFGTLFYILTATLLIILFGDFLFG